jgi:hypothetical protein
VTDRDKQEAKLSLNVYLLMYKKYFLSCVRRLFLFATSAHNLYFYHISEDMGGKTRKITVFHGKMR